MPKKFILQGVTTDSHLDEIRDIFQLEDIERIVISVAFLNERGFALLADLLGPVADRTTVFAGIRNGITSAQGLLASLECGCATYAVDTGSRSVIFHPKIYLAQNPVEAHVVLGSANLTAGGLHGNIEASIRVNADMSVESDADFVNDVLSKIDAMTSDFPDHVLRLSSRHEVLELLRAGRVIDEARALPPTPGGSSADRDLDGIPNIRLRRRPVRLTGVTRLEHDDVHDESDTEASEDTTHAAGTTTASAAAPTSRPATEALELVWMSNPLTRRPLNIPTGTSTNPPSVTIDVRSFFVNI